MTKLKPYLFWGLVFLIGLVVGVFKFQNLEAVHIDNLFTPYPLKMALGNALVWAFVFGFVAGVLLMAVHWGIQKLENGSLRRQLLSLEKQLEKARELNK